MKAKDFEYAALFSSPPTLPRTPFLEYINIGQTMTCDVVNASFPAVRLILAELTVQVNKP
jgi:hypothetical protein